MPPAPPAADTSVNAELQAELARCDAAIKNHFGDLMGEPTDECGVPVYNAAKAAEKLSAGKTYTCACPLYWANLGYELQPNMPKYRSRLENLHAHFFEKPATRSRAR